MPETLCYIFSEFDFYFISDFIISTPFCARWRNRKGHIFPSVETARPYASYYFRNCRSFDSYSKHLKDYDGLWSTFLWRNIIDSMDYQFENGFFDEERDYLFQSKFSDQLFLLSDFGSTWFSPLRSGPRITCPSMISSLY